MIERAKLPLVLAAALAAAGCVTYTDRDLAPTLRPATDPQPKAPAPAQPAAPAAKLYDRLGGEKAIAAVVDELLARVAADARINARFDGANMPRLRLMLIDLLCNGTGGPQAYRGASMKQAHAGMGITSEEFDALVGDLVGALDKFKVPDREKQELLAILGPMRKDIVTEPPTVEQRLERMEGALLRIEQKIDAGRVAPPAKLAAPKPAVHAAPWNPDEKNLAESLVQRYATAEAKVETEPRLELLGRPLVQTRFVSSEGEVFDLKDFAGKKKVVLVILRGFAGQVCINCSTQTIALADNIDKFRAKNAEVVLVYPGEAETVPAFLEAVRNLREGFKVPFPILLDVDLAAVRTFRIEGSLAKPTTLVLDEDGAVRWAYVGKQPADRPSAKVLLEIVDRIGAKK